MLEVPVNGDVLQVEKQNIIDNKPLNEGDKNIDIYGEETIKSDVAM